MFFDRAVGAQRLLAGGSHPGWHAGQWDLRGRGPWPQQTLPHHAGSLWGRAVGFSCPPHQASGDDWEWRSLCQVKLQHFPECHLLKLVWKCTYWYHCLPFGVVILLSFNTHSFITLVYFIRNLHIFNQTDNLTSSACFKVWIVVELQRLIDKVGDQ